MALNPYQQNALEVGMRHLERTLLEARQLLRHVPEAGRLTSFQPIAEVIRPELEASIDQMLTEIEVVAARFKLEPRAEAVGNHIGAEMFAVWSELQGLLSDKLKRAGEVDPTISTALDPHIQRLIALAHRMANSARG
jgi:hypothetical protein